MQPETYTTQPTTDLFLEEPAVYSGFWRRVFALIIDSVILLIPNYLLQYLTSEITGSILSIPMYWIYFAAQESGNSQATIGKKALGIKVTNEQGQKITFGQATGRYFGKILSGIILFIGYLMMLWDDKKQTLHDKLAGSYVVKTRD
jgi:uncharacterized RDD family membrane protein YckC